MQGRSVASVSFALTVRRQHCQSFQIHAEVKGQPRLKRAAVAPAALDLGDHTQASLEALGLDRLKAALLALGLKCGGTLRDRAERLLSTRGKDRADWDPKILAKPKKKG